MGLRTNAVFIGLATALSSSLASALGLGEIKLHSALNQPLDAEIQLLHVRDLTEREIVVGLASPTDYERAGVDRVYFLSDIKFDVDLNAPEGPVVKVRSSDPVREPFLDFIVTAEWPSGKLLREYTLLVDLPVFAEERPGSVEATQTRPAPRRTEQPSTSTDREVRPQPTTPTASRPAAPRDSVGMEEYGPVGANENLWSIANRLRPDSDVSVQQTMLALQRLNPEAFINNNINLLRRGQVLRVPTKDDIQSLTSRQAMQEVAEQNRSWSERSTRTDRAAQLDGSKTVTDDQRTAPSVEGRIKLSSAEERTATNGVGAGDGDSGDSAVQGELTVTQEELDAATRENAELKSRVQAIEEQISTMERLVQVSNDELRSLEVAAQQVNENEDQTGVTDDSTTQAQPEDSVQPADGEETTPPIDDQALASTPGEVEDDATVAQTPPESTADAAEKPAQSTPRRQQATWLDWVKENLLMVAGGVGGLVILIAALLFMRKKDDGFDDFDDEEFESSVEPFASADEFPEEQDEYVAHDEDSAFLGETDVDGDFEESVHAEAETEDVVGECDIHIAYGQYDQAEEKLSRALDKEPRNIPVRMKLLEVFAIQGDLEGFDSHYAKLRALGDDEASDRAAALRESFPDASAFDESRYDTTAFLALVGAGAAVAARGNESEVSDLSNETVNFDFDEEMESDKSADADDLENTSLDFDLDFDDDTTQIPAVPPVDSMESQSSSEDDLDELDSELDDIEFDIEDDDLEVDLDFEDDRDATRLASGNEQTLDDSEATADFNEFEVALDESATAGFEDSALNELDDELSDDLDIDDVSGFRASSDTVDLTESVDSLDFDLDKDLEAAIASKEPEEGDFTDLDMNDLGELDLEESLSDEDVTSELEIDDDFGEDLSVDEVQKKTVASNDLLDESDDFDMDYNLEGDVDLDDLDQELGELDIDMSDDNEDDVSGQMEEPQTNFEEVEDLADSPQVATPVARNAAEENDIDIPDFDPENDDDSGLEFLSENDETATKLDLARAYIDMGDADGAKDILDEIVEEGSDDQKREAETLLSKLAS